MESRRHAQVSRHGDHVQPLLRSGESHLRSDRQLRTSWCSDAGGALRCRRSRSWLEKIQPPLDGLQQRFQDNFRGYSEGASALARAYQPKTGPAIPATQEIMRRTCQAATRSSPSQEMTGFGFSELIPNSLMALSTMDFSIFPSVASSWSVANVMKRESTSKNSRNDARPSLRPKPSVPSEASRR